MNRRFTNFIRFLIDECLPPIIRDSRLFMYPFFFFAYRGRNVHTTMAFKSRVWKMSKDDYTEFYKNLKSISRDRQTDLNSECIARIGAILKNGNFDSVLDVGCGNGFLLNELAKNFPDKKFSGIDVKTPSTKNFSFTQGDISEMPFKDRSFDLVICSHVLEHCTNLKEVISEIKRVAKKNIIVVVPCQRPYYYTLDEHVHFFYYKELLTHNLGLDSYECEKLKGDWFYSGQITEMFGKSSRAC